MPGTSRCRSWSSAGARGWAATAVRAADQTQRAVAIGRCRAWATRARRPARTSSAGTRWATSGRRRGRAVGRWPSSSSSRPPRGAPTRGPRCAGSCATRQRNREIIARYPEVFSDTFPGSSVRVGQGADRTAGPCRTEPGSSGATFRDAAVRWRRPTGLSAAADGAREARAADAEGEDVVEGAGVGGDRRGGRAGTKQSEPGCAVEDRRRARRRRCRRRRRGGAPAGRRCGRGRGCCRATRWAARARGGGSPRRTRSGSR